tara:strand:- start:170 stop:1066 length:897 start_codon:yes stop_codon:yes gene_type:complete
MISAIVFSKDNPARLHLLLESIHRTNGNIFDITVLYECSSQEMVEGYDFAKRYFYYKNKSGFHFPVRWKQRESENITLDLLECLATSRNLVCILNDENIFYSSIPSYKKITKLFQENLLSSLSLRLGNNTIIQNPYMSEAYFIDKPKKGDFIDDTFMVWNASEVYPYTNFAIPFSINGHIYYTDFLANWVLDIELNDYEDFESVMQKRLYADLIDKVPPTMASLEYSAVINNSNRKISDENPKNTDLGVGRRSMNVRYLDGYLIDYNSFNFSHISKPFEDFALRFKHEDYMYYSYTSS